MIKVLMHQDDGRILHVYAPNELQTHEAQVVKLQGEIGKFTNR